MDRYLLIKGIVEKGFKSVEVINRVIADYSILDLITDEQYTELHLLNNPVVEEVVEEEIE